MLASWNEDEGWCVGLHHDPAHTSRLYLLPASTNRQLPQSVAEESWSGDPVTADVDGMQAALDASLSAWLDQLRAAAE